MKSLHSRILCLTLCFWAATTALAQDADKDGIPDETEIVLGSDPGAADTFTTIWARPATVKPGADPARTFRSVAVANAGGNRFLWRIEFLAPYPQTNSSLLLYLDADDNKNTGRQPDHGCEFMLHWGGGFGGVSAFTPDGKTRPTAPPRVAAVGNNVYFSYDVDLAQRDGASVFRLNVLSEAVNPHRGVQGSGYFEAKGPPISNRPRAKLDSDLTGSVGVEQTWGLDRINALVEDPKNFPIWIRDCKLDGFRFDRSEYRADNALRTSGKGTITATVPPGASGRFHVGFIFYDSAGREVIAINVNGQRRGVAVADFNDNNQHLFFLTEPVELKPGDTIQLCALGAEGNYKTEDLVLLRDKPAARPPLYEFREVAATENRLTWITSWAAQCTVEYGRGQTITEPIAVQNHRVVLPDVKPGQRVRYRITAKTRDGRDVATDWREFTWRPASEPKTKLSGRVTLRVEPPASVGDKLRDWPVTSGVPFPKGALGGARNVRLLNANGAVVPLQAAVTGRWQDGSVKWLLLDFRHSGGAADYTLEFGPKITRREPSQKFDAPAELGELVLTDAMGKDQAARIANFQPEETGGLRRCARATGRIGDAPFTHDTRVHVYPGLPWARVLLNVGHSESTNEFTTIRSLAWRLPALRGEPRFVRQH
ncbi:MAG: hypothetical protein N2689_15365, partial [Verrucomicrobiae bacterium]|nr:hypothetical protein [Verrucomicrobiae bacterium]